MQRTRVVVHIDRLVLRGFRAEDRHAIAAGLRDELTRVLTPTGAAQRVATIGNVARVRAGTASTGTPRSARAVGTDAARSIGRALTR